MSRQYCFVIFIAWIASTPPVVEVQRDNLEHVARAVRPQDVLIGDPVAAGADVDPDTSHTKRAVHK